MPGSDQFSDLIVPISLPSHSDNNGDAKSAHNGLNHPFANE